MSRVRFAEVGSRRGRSWVGVRAMGSVPADFSKPRKVVKKVLSQAQPEGDGATVRRSIGRFVLRVWFELDFGDLGWGLLGLESCRIL